MINFVAITTVPSGPPQNFTVITTSDFCLFFMWSPPLLSKRNGDIIRYFVVCTLLNRIISGQVSSTGASVYLLPWAATKYTCFVRAGTVVGYGPPSANFSGIIGNGMFMYNVCTCITNYMNTGFS